jgi:hypothetical protein
MMSFKPLVDVRSCSSSSSSEDDSRYCYYDRDLDVGGEGLATSMFRYNSAIHPTAAAAASSLSTSSPTTIIFREVSLLQVDNDPLGRELEDEEDEQQERLSSSALMHMSTGDGGSHNNSGGLPPSIPLRGLQRANPVREEEDDDDDDDEDEDIAAEEGENQDGSSGRKRRRRNEFLGEEEPYRHSTRASPFASRHREEDPATGGGGRDVAWASTYPLGSLENVLDGECHLFLQPRRYYADAGLQDDDLFYVGGGGTRGERGEDGGGIVDYSRFFEAEGDGDGTDDRTRIVLLCEPGREQPREGCAGNQPYPYGAGIGLAFSSEDEPVQDDDEEEDDFSLSSQEAISILDQDRLFGRNDNGGSVVFEPINNPGENDNDHGRFEAFWAGGVVSARSSGSESSRSSTVSSPPAQISLSSGMSSPSSGTSP